MGSQRAGYDWATELNWKAKYCFFHWRSQACLYLGPVICDYSVPQENNVLCFPIRCQWRWEYTIHGMLQARILKWVAFPFSSCPQSLPASGSFPLSQLFTSGGQSIRVSALASVPPMNSQDWSPLGWTSWISLQSKGLSRVFSNTTVQKHQFFGAQFSSQSNSYIHIWPLEKP